MIQREVIEEVIRRNDIEQVIGRYVDLRRAGSNLVGLCPFHSEKTPSFTVFRNTDSFYCFGCAAGGNVITFIQKIENLDYVSAVQSLAKDAGIEIPDDKDYSVRGPSRERIREMNTAAARFFHNCLIYDHQALQARAYLEKRELSGSTIKHFYLGYDPGGAKLVKHLKSLGFSDEEMLAGFLAGRSDKGIYDLFFNRVVFPIVDTSKNIVGFGGRVLDDSKPKYLNTSDTAAFKKSRNLFALNYAKDFCKEQLLICEGYMDVVTLHQAGIQNAVATLGTSITEEHARLLSRYTSRVILSYDSDEAGIKATNRAMSILDGIGVDVRVLTMEGAKDPDEYIKKYGVDAFKRLLNGSSTGFDYKMTSAISKYNLADTSEKVRAVKDVVIILAGYGSAIERDLYSVKASEKLSVSLKSLKEDVEKQRRKLFRKNLTEEMQEARSSASRFGDRINTESVSNVKAVSAEETVLGLLLIYQEYRDAVLSGRTELRPEHFCTSFSRRVFEKILEINSSDGGFMTPLMGEFFTPDEMGRIESMEMHRRQLNENGPEVFEAAVNVLKRESIELGDKKASGITDFLAEKRRRLDEERKKRNGAD